MIIVKYTKLNSFALLSHRDILHNFCRTIRRANLHVAFSDGYNPHEKLYFGNPTSLGQLSLSEYVTVDSEENAQEFMQKFNEKAAGTKIVLAKNAKVNPNFAHILVANEFVMEMQGIENCADLINTIATDKNFELEYKKSGKKVFTADKIFSYNLSQNRLSFVCKCGVDALKADELCDFVASHNANRISHNGGYYLIKTAQFYLQGNKLCNADKLFE